MTEETEHLYGLSRSVEIAVSHARWSYLEYTVQFARKKIVVSSTEEFLFDHRSSPGQHRWRRNNGATPIPSVERESANVKDITGSNSHHRECEKRHIRLCFSRSDFSLTLSLSSLRKEERISSSHGVSTTCDRFHSFEHRRCYSHLLAHRPRTRHSLHTYLHPLDLEPFDLQSLQMGARLAHRVLSSLRAPLFAHTYDTGLQYVRRWHGHLLRSESLRMDPRSAQRIRSVVVLRHSTRTLPSSRLHAADQREEIRRQEQEGNLLLRTHSVQQAIQVSHLHDVQYHQILLTLRSRHLHHERSLQHRLLSQLLQIVPARAHRGQSAERLPRLSRLHD